mmetsp:Transcript_25428/g.39879  ORF Transcript_25428/g.39879 Transcript_25428/m.39879 type:complete len:224 (+) Transcript_25428:130-801(+)
MNQVENVAEQVMGAFASEEDSDEAQATEPLRGEDLRQRSAIKTWPSGISEGPRARSPSALLSFCLVTTFIVVAVLVFIASVKMAVDPSTAQVSHHQIHEMERNIRSQIKTSMKAQIKVQKKATKERKSDQKEVQNLEKQVKSLARQVRDLRHRGGMQPFVAVQPEQEPERAVPVFISRNPPPEVARGPRTWPGNREESMAHLHHLARKTRQGGHGADGRRGSQ